jgi:hypothetical protein
MHQEKSGNPGLVMPNERDNCVKIGHRVFCGKISVFA